MTNSIKHNNGSPSIITINGKSFTSKCINCKNKKCIKYRNDEISNDSVKIPVNIDNNVCPVNAISSNNGKIYINTSKCIKCGLCASRCITGAIYYNGSVFTVDEYASDSEEKYNNIEHFGQIIKEDTNLLNEIYNKIVQSNINPNIISRNLLNQCGIQTYLSRKGDVNLRMDAILLNNDKKGVCEIEFNNDVLSCPRCILDDLAVLCSRYGYDLKDTLSLVVALGLPNNRTDYWRVIKDINNILDVKIQTVSIGFLLIAMWNFKKINLISNDYYKDCDDNSLTSEIQVVLDRKINIIKDDNSIFETIK